MAAPSGAELRRARRLRVLGGSHRLFLALLGAALLVRFVLVALEPHGAEYFADSLTYLLVDPFADPRAPGGYQLFAHGLHAIAPSLTLLIAVQHLLGLGSAVALYSAGRSAGLSAPAASLATLPMLFAGEVLLLEHTALTDALAADLLNLALACLVFSLGERRRRFVLAAGLLLGLAATVRTVAIPVAVGCGLWLLVAWRETLPRRLLAGALFAAAFAGVVAVYLGVASTGRYTGFGGARGDYLYARAAPFADCRFFTPPRGTRGLCETSPPALRPGPVFYQGEPGAPKLRVFPDSRNHPEAHNAQLEAFGRAAILGQPRAYFSTVLDDYLRYFENDPMPRSYSGAGWDVLTLGVLWPPQTQDVAGRLKARYADATTEPPHGRGLLLLYSSVTQVRGVVLAALVLFGAVGLALRSSLRSVAGLGLLVFLVLTVVPVATITYSQRYMVPAYGALGLAAAVGLQSLLERAQSRRHSPLPQ
jgi:hypothetical protein